MRKVLALLDRLKPQQRTVLWLRMAGLSYKEICDHTGHTYTWVNRHVTEGREALRRLIEEEPQGRTGVARPAYEVNPERKPVSPEPEGRT